MMILRCWGFRQSQWLVLTVLLMGIAYLQIPSVSASSSSFANSNYNVYHYDTTTPQFTPDGRLLQVEYATAAADHSTPLLVCRVNDDTLILLSLQHTASSSSSSSSAPARRGKSQDRLVVLDGRVVVAMSGVLADSMALLREASQAWLSWKRTYGDDEASQDNNRNVYYQPSLFDSKSVHMHRVVAQAMGNQCQTHAFGGGIRPYGATMLVVAMLPTDDDKDDTPQSPFSLLQTDPSGAVSTISLQQPQKDTSLEIVAIIGGGSNARSKLEKDLHRKWRRSSLFKTTKQQSSNPVWKSLQTMTRVLWKHHQRELQQDEKGWRRKVKDASTKRGDLWLEAVILSKDRGIHRLTESQVEALIQSVVGDEVNG